MTVPAPSVEAAPTAGGAPGPSAGRARRPRLSLDTVSFFLVFLGLPLALFLVFVIWPFVQAAFYAFTDWAGFSTDFAIIGFDNFVRLFNDSLFMTAMWNNIRLAFWVPLITLVVALAFATLITVGGRGVGQTQGVAASGFYRVVSFFPYVIPAVVTAVIFGRVFDPSSGLLNGFFRAIGLDGAAQNWLGQVSTAMPASVFVIIWGYIGFYMLLFIAAIKGIPAEVFEAARLDGAGRARTTWSITLPMIRTNVQTAWIYIGIASLDAFVTMAILNPQGGPDNSTLVMPQYLFRLAFSQGQFGYASAMGVMMAVVTLAFAALVFVLSWLAGGRERSR